MDVAYVGALLGFLALVWAFAAGCETLGGRQ